MTVQNRIKKMLGIKTGFLGWEEYSKRIDFLDQFAWQQSVREHNVRTPGL